MLSIIVAMGNDRVIGKNNQLIWHLPEDLKRFKELTTGKTIIMGRKTFDSLGRVLPNRKHIVLTHNPNLTIDHEQVKVIHSVEELKKYQEEKEEHFVIGGAKIYELLLPYVKKMYITQIHESFEGDTFFPEWKKNEWKVVEQVPGKKDEKNPYDYEYITYERK